MEEVCKVDHSKDFEGLTQEDVAHQNYLVDSMMRMVFDGPEEKTPNMRPPIEYPYSYGDPSLPRRQRQYYGDHVYYGDQKPVDDAILDNFSSMAIHSHVEQNHNVTAISKPATETEISARSNRHSEGLAGINLYYTASGEPKLVGLNFPHCVQLQAANPNGTLVYSVIPGPRLHVNYNYLRCRRGSYPFVNVKVRQPTRGGSHWTGRGQQGRRRESCPANFPMPQQTNSSSHWERRMSVLERGLPRNFDFTRKCPEHNRVSSSDCAS